MASPFRALSQNFGSSSLGGVRRKTPAHPSHCGRGCGAVKLDFSKAITLQRILGLQPMPRFCVGHLAHATALAHVCPWHPIVRRVG